MKLPGNLKRPNQGRTKAEPRSKKGEKNHFFTGSCQLISCSIFKKWNKTIIFITACYLIIYTKNVK